MFGSKAVKDAALNEQEHAGNVVPRIILRLHVGHNGVLIESGPAIARSSVTCQRSGACASRTATRPPPVC